MSATPPPYCQRLSLERLNAWEALGYGMFIHFGMSTFDGDEFSKGMLTPADFNPAKLDVEQWVATAKEAGMRYAVLTTKHVAGFCLWPSEHTDYHIGNSPVGGDLVGDFVAACHKHGLRPGLYYCSWDNHHTFGGECVSDVWGKVDNVFKNTQLASEYLEFQRKQLAELLTKYQDIEEVWIDIPALLTMGYRRELYDQCARLQPDCLVVMNNGIHERQRLRFEDSWPTDVMTIERDLPRVNGFNPYIERQTGWDARHTFLEKDYYIPAEVCDTIGYEWFYEEEDPIRSIEELAGMYHITRARGANLLLDVGPTPEGLIHTKHRDALLALRERIEPSLPKS